MSFTGGRSGQWQSSSDGVGPGGRVREDNRAFMQRFYGLYLSVRELPFPGHRHQTLRLQLLPAPQQLLVFLRVEAVELLHARPQERVAAPAVVVEAQRVGRRDQPVAPAVAQQQLAAALAVGGQRLGQDDRALLAADADDERGDDD